MHGVCVCARACTARPLSSIQSLDSSVSSCSYQVHGHGKPEELCAWLLVPVSLFPGRHFQYVYSEVIRDALPCLNWLPPQTRSSCPEVRMSSTMRRSHLVSVQLANGVFKHPPLHLHYCLASSNIPPQKSSPPVCVHACTHVRASQRSRTRGAFIAHAPSTCTYATHPTRKTHGGFTSILCSPSNV